MGWFDQLVYNLGQASPIGRAIEGGKQQRRVMDVANGYTNAPNLSQFAAVPTPDNIYDPASLVELEKLKEARKGVLQQQEAAPIAKMLSRFAAEGNDADPSFNGAEWIKGMATTDAGMDPEEYDRLATGAVPAQKKGGAPISAFAANPITAKLIQDAELTAQNKGTLARTFGREASPMDLATIAMNKDIAAGFDNTTQGSKRLFDQGQGEGQNAANNAINQTIANYPLQKTVESWNGLVNALNKIPGADPKLIDARLKDIQSRNAGPAGNRLEMFAESGNATTRGNVQTDMFGNPISETKVTATNHAPQSKEDKSGEKKAKDADRSYSKIRDLRLAKAAVEAKDDPLNPGKFTGQVKAYDKSIKDAIARHNQQFPDDKVEAEPAPFDLVGNGKQVSIDSKGKPVALEVKKLNGKTYRRIGPGPGDWVSD